MYASQLDLEAAYGTGLIARLSDNDNEGEADQDAIDSALEVARAINRRLSRRPLRGAA